MAREFFGGKARRKVLLGAKLDKASALLPQNSTDPLFNILSGRVILTSLVGEVTVQIQGQTTNIKIQSNPTTGTTSDIAADLDATGDGIGTLYGITGEFGTAVVGGEEGATNILSTPVILQIGTLDLECGETSTGEIKWSATYIPYDDGAEMTVA